MGLLVPEELGGGGGGPVEMVLVAGELSRCGTDLATDTACAIFSGRSWRGMELRHSQHRVKGDGADKHRAVTDGGGTVELEADGSGLAILWLNRPDRLNAISFQMIADVHEALDALERDISQRVVILAGRGRAFCAGTDLTHDIADWPEPGGLVQKRIREQERLAEVIVRLREISQAVIAAIHGHAVGGGLALAAAADMRVADTTAVFSAAFIRVGLSGGDVGVSWMLPRLVGMSRSTELLFTGRSFDADEADRIGLLSRLVDEGAQLAVATEIARQVLAHAPLGVRMTKTLLGASMGAPALRSHVELENRTQVICALTDDFAEGVRAFQEKRAPDTGMRERQGASRGAIPPAVDTHQPGN